jgi:hypothetical protein
MEHAVAKALNRSLYYSSLSVGSYPLRPILIALSSPQVNVGSVDDVTRISLGSARNELFTVNTFMSGLVTVFVSSLDTRSERRFDLQLPISQLKVSNLINILSLCMI